MEEEARVQWVLLVAGRVRDRVVRVRDKIVVLVGVTVRSRVSTVRDIDREELGIA